MGAMASFSQTTSIPDANFEAFLETHNADGEVVDVGDTSSMGDGIENNNLVTTANINTVTSLDVLGKGIAHLRGIEDFVLLETLNCSSNVLTVLDLTKNSSLTSLNCESNSLIYLNVKNGNTLAITTFNALENENLSCIQIDDEMIAPFNWEYDNQEGFNMEFNLNCGLTYVPDDNFEAYLETHNSTGDVVPVGDVSSMGDGIENNNLVATANISEVTSLTVSGLEISDLTGIEAFAALRFLNCDYNTLSSLDMSGNLNLDTVYANNNNLTSINVSNNTVLTQIYCSNNNISNLDVSLNVNLRGLYCSNNALSVLNVSTNTALTALYCGYNNLTSLDVSTNVSLNYLSFSNNSISSINLSSNTDLITLNSGQNNLTELNVANNTALETLLSSNNNLGDLDISTNTVLEELYVQFAQLTDLDISNNMNLEDLSCSYNNLSGSLDVSAHTNLEYLDASENYFSSLNVKNGNNSNFRYFYANANPNLTCIEVDDVDYSTTNWNYIDATASFNTTCSLTSVPDANFEAYLETHNATGDVVPVGDASSMGDGIANNNLVATANISEVTSMTVSSLEISDLTGIEAFAALRFLNCDYNTLSSLDMSGNLNLDTVYANNNNLTSINVSNNTVLTQIYCSNNNISNLDVSLNVNLRGLYCSNNALSVLNVSTNTALTALYCGYNNLTSLDVSTNVSLNYLSFSNNSISSINLSSNTDLITLNSGQNNLTELNVANNTALETLLSSNNNLGDLDISTNTVLEELYVQFAQLTDLDISNNMNLEDLSCSYNNLSGSLDVSAHTNLEYLDASENYFSSLNVKNGNNSNFRYFYANANPNLTCIEVDDVDYSTTNWNYIDDTSTFVNSQEECAALGVEGIEKLNVSIYPNPSKGAFTIEVLEVSDLILYSAIGKEVFRKPLNSGQNQLNDLNLSKGLYFVKISSKEKVMTKKLIIE